MGILDKELDMKYIEYTVYKNVGLILESLVYVSAIEVEISGSEYEKKTHFEKRAFKDMDCKILYILQDTRCE